MQRVRLFTLVVMSLSLSACMFPVPQEQRHDERYGNERENRHEDNDREHEQRRGDNDREHEQRRDERN